jgi:hypothetical protein
MTPFHYDIRDVFRAPRLALSAKKILLQFIGFLLGYLGYLVFTYLAFWSADMSISDTWELHGLFPLSSFPFDAWYSWVIFVFGVIWFVIWWLLASTMVGKVTFEQLKGDDFYSSKEAFRFLKKHWGPAFFSPLSLLAFIAFLLICGIIVGLIGKIPYVGELGIGIFYLIPLFAVALTLAYVIFVFFFSLLLAPAVVAALKEDTFETLVQIFTTIWNQAWRYFVYTGLIGVMSKIGMFIFGYFCFRAVQLIHGSLGVFMGGKLSDITEQALSYITIPDHLLDYFTNIFAGIEFRFHLPEIGPGLYLQNWTQEVAAFLIGISLILVIFMVFSYGLAVISTGQTVTYIVLRKKKDDEDLLERKTEAEEEEERRELEEKEKEEKEKAAEGEEKQAEEKPSDQTEEKGEGN